MDKADLLEEVFALLRDSGIRFCVIGGQAVNAYVEPLVSLDLDLVVAVNQLDHVDTLMREHFQVEAFPHSLNISSAGSNLRVQFQTDPRYGAARLWIDKIIDPIETRDAITQALEAAALNPDVPEFKVGVLQT